MAQKGRKKPSRQPRHEKEGPSPPQAGQEPLGADWSPGKGPSREEEAAVQGEEDPILDVDPVRESEDRAREFSLAENPFLEAEDDRLPREDPVPLHPPEDADLEEPTFGGRPRHAERIVPWREHEGEVPAPILPGAGFLDALFLDYPFPARKEDVACHLAQEAHAHGGPAPAFHDMVVQLDEASFENLGHLKRSLGDRFAWEAAHSRPGSPGSDAGGLHG